MCGPMTERLSHYRILKKLGSGGMGEVYLAEDERLHRRVALKVLPPEGADQDRLKRFLREAHAASAINHPNVAVIHEVSEAPDQVPFIVMEYIDGDTLEKRLAAGPLPVDEIVELGRQIADAMDEAHSKGVIHRDLKPSNVMLTSRGHAKVLDFGLAKLLTEELTDTDATRLKSEPGLVLGTIPYMSPEQALGRSVDARSDIFSLGALLYEMATGQRPFAGRSPSEIIEQIVHAAPKAIGRLNYDVPPELERIIRKCLEKDPASRYQSAREIVVDLRTLKRDSSPGVIRPERRSSRFRAAILAVTALLVTAAVVAAVWHFRDRTDSRPTIDSIAVLPFANSSKDPQNEYLSDGLTESIINSLSQLPELKVMSRSTVFRFKASDADAQNVGRQLNVRAVVSGRVSQIGDRLIVAAELVNTADGAQLWGEQYSRHMSDILAIQEEISREISEKLRIHLSGPEQQRMTRRPTDDPEAYQLYLKGRYYWNQRTASSLQRAVTLFRQAIEKDPRYALAYVALAESYVVLPEYAGAPAHESMLQARAAAQQALDLDPSVAEAHATLSLVESHLWNHAAAEAQMKRAFELKPNYATAYHWYSLHLRRLHRLDEALEAIMTARELDPLSPIINLAVGVQHYTRGDYAQAIREYDSVLSLAPDFAWARTYVGRVHVTAGRCREGLEHLRAGADRAERAREALGWLAYGEARCSNRSDAERIAAELEQRFNAGRGSAMSLAVSFVGLGDLNAALDTLEKGYAARDGSLIDIPAEPEFEPLRGDPRYRDLMRRIGLPQGPLRRSR